MLAACRLRDQIAAIVSKDRLLILVCAMEAALRDNRHEVCTTHHYVNLKLPVHAHTPQSLHRLHSALRTTAATPDCVLGSNVTQAMLPAVQGLRGSKLEGHASEDAAAHEGWPLWHGCALTCMSGLAAHASVSVRTPTGPYHCAGGSQLEGHLPQDTAAHGGWLVRHGHALKLVRGSGQGALLAADICSSGWRLSASLAGTAVVSFGRPGCACLASFAVQQAASSKKLAAAEITEKEKAGVWGREALSECTEARLTSLLRWGQGVRT